MIFSIILSVVFLVLGIIHFNWVCGGTYGFAESLPTMESGERLLNPRKIDSAIVGIGLIAFGIFYLYKSGLLDYDLPNGVMNYGGWIIPITFFARAIGDFKYVGFFKTVVSTDFGKLDSLFFSPLCLVIGVLGILVQVMR